MFPCSTISMSSTADVVKHDSSAKIRIFSVDIFVHEICLRMRRALQQVTEMTRIKEHVSRMALVNNNVAITVLDSCECLHSLASE